MKTLTSTVAAPRARARTRFAGSNVSRAGVLVAGLLLCGAPALAQSPTPRADDPALAPQGQVEPPLTNPVPPPVAEPTVVPEPSPTGTELPDEVSAQEMKGEYGVGLGLLILGGVVIAAAVVGLFMWLMRRTWSETDASAPSRH